jgi:DNA-binding transcriptional ArsR family regulator
LYSVLTDSSRQMGDAAETVGESTGASLASLDKLLEHRSRLAACVLLSNADRLSFSRLKELLKETDGNLGAHLRKLEDAAYVTLEKKFENRRPVSWYALSKQGRKALKIHLAALEVLIKQSSV